MDVNPRWPKVPSRYLYAQEPIEQALPEMQALIKMQYDETGDHALPCEPNWAIYRALESAGRGAVLLCRRDGVAVGYIAMILHPHMNSAQIPVGTISTYYAPQVWSRAIILREMIRNASAWLLQRGARQIFIDTEYQHSAGKLLERLGFTPVKIGYRMSLVGDGTCRISG